MLTHEQELAYEAIMTKQFVAINAKAGTGKTWLAVKAAYELYQKEKKQLIYTFSPVMEDVMGFLPGSKQEKEEPYTQPLKDALNSLGIKPITAIQDPNFSDDHAVNRGAWIKTMSHVHARGINIKNSTLIIDEAQNWTVPELRKILTRCHADTKVIMIGHTGQIDLKDPKQSGFEPYMYHFATKPYYEKCHLTINHRGELAQWADEMR